MRIAEKRLGVKKRAMEVFHDNAAPRNYFSNPTNTNGTVTGNSTPLGAQHEHRSNNNNNQSDTSGTVNSIEQRWKSVHISHQKDRKK